MPQERGHRRRRSRSESPIPSKHKRSWQNAAGDNFGGREHYNQPASPVRGGKRDFRSPAKVSDRRNYPSSPGLVNKSHHAQARKAGHSDGRDISVSYPRHSTGPPPRSRDKTLSAPHGDNDWQRSMSKQRSGSVRSHHVREHRRESRTKRLSPSHKPGPSVKLPQKQSSAVVKHSRSRSRGRSPVPSLQTKKDLSSSRDNFIPQRKVSSSSSKRKTPSVTLHKRFTFDDQDPFEIEDNVTIAILRKPDAQPSEDVTVKRVFDASQFKMIHKKTEGRKPIFDREEIKLWRHDDNLTDDPDYEYRLVRVKSTSGASTSASGGPSRMSPDVIRKAVGLQASGKSHVLSPHAEPQIRLDPRPDSRYEPRFRQQVDKEDELRSTKRRDGDKKRGFNDKRGSNDIRDGKGFVRDQQWEGEKTEDRGKRETYDLRQALERRRSDKEEGGFRIKVRHNSIPEPGGYYTDIQQAGHSQLDHRKFPASEVPGRSVVVDENRARKPLGARDRSSDWNERRFGDGQGYVARNRGSRGEWSPGRGETDTAMREDAVTAFRDVDRSFEKRRKYSNSPPPTRGWRGGFRGSTRGRTREFVPFEPDFPLPTVINDSFRYSQHDDRDASPTFFRGRGGRGRFGPRNFGGKNFRAVTRGMRGGFRGFRRGTRARGFGSLGDRRSVERVRDISADREWKHDMYDSLQATEDQPHSSAGGI